MDKMDKMVKPVFLKQKDIPDSENNRPTVLEICRAAEKSSGLGSILGAQVIRELWRVYPTTREARDDLLVKRIIIRGTSIAVANSNPYILREDTGEEKLTTKVWIDDIPMSVADEEIEIALAKAGCEMRSKIIADRARDDNNKLTRFFTGKRFVFITIPGTPLDRTIKVSNFTARLYHKEQKTAKTICSNCLETDHHKSVCTRDVVCRACRLPGHKQGDPTCDLPRREQQSGRKEKDLQDKQKTEEDQRESSSRKDRREEKETAERSKEKERRQPNSRSRPFTRQTTLRPSLELDRQPRCRSETPKRRRSRELRSPTGNNEKQARRDSDGKEATTTRDYDTDTDTETAKADMWH